MWFSKVFAQEECPTAKLVEGRESTSGAASSSSDEGDTSGNAEGDSGGEANDEGESEGGGGDDDEDELVDPLDELREKCKHTDNECKRLAKLLDSCTERVTRKTKTMETCREEFNDLWYAMDVCALRNGLWSKLK